MEIRPQERKKMIKELQELAENVLSLKAEHRQKRPIVIEFSGSPKAGKTSCINSLELFLKRNGFSVKVIQERASVCPVSDKQSPMFNIWTSCMSLAGLIGTLEDKSSNVDVLILDRGIFDALCWFEWLSVTDKMEDQQKVITEHFLLMEELIKSIDIVFAFCVEPHISIEREYANLLTDKIGTIMNKTVLEEYLSAIRRTIESKKAYFHSVFEIDTSNKGQDEVGKEVTTKTLETLKDLLMERIGYIQKTKQIDSIICNRKVIAYNDLVTYLPPIKFDLREIVESNLSYLQPLPIAVITNKEKNKLLVIKKNKNAISITSPEKDKHLIYIGGHSRYEDKTEVNSTDFISICKTALKREIKEEIGISVALNNIEPLFIYSKEKRTSQKHLAVCFVVSVDEESIKLRLDSHELVQNKGKSKSGRFLSFHEIQQFELEEWSKTILKTCFDVDFPEQLSITDDFN
ncbi:MAG: NUDIX hydrolase [Clostridia bacterium]|nr:NUDIX hydrolase [Clostridia bacterium]